MSAVTWTMPPDRLTVADMRDVTDFMAVHDPESGDLLPRKFAYLTWQAVATYEDGSVGPVLFYVTVTIPTDGDTPEARFVAIEHGLQAAQWMMAHGGASLEHHGDDPVPLSEFEGKRVVHWRWVLGSERVSSEQGIGR